MTDWLRSKAHAQDYALSEHVVRSLLAREVDVQDIAETLLEGRVIEDHFHQSRPPAWLILGQSGGRVVHLLCARLPSGQLVVLFAYRPRPPAWLGPARRAGESEMPQNLPAPRCFFCGGPLKEIVVGNFDYRLEGQLYVIKNTPASLCEQCGEKYVSAPAAKRINDMVAQGRFAGREEVLVLDFQGQDQP